MAKKKKKKKRVCEEEKKRICEEEDKVRGYLVFSHLSDESRGIFVHSHAQMDELSSENQFNSATSVNR